MDFIRVYSGEDGESHFEDIDPTKWAEWGGAAVTGFSIRQLRSEPMDWHPAPRRQLIIHLSGQVEIGLRDGTAHVFGPGSARLMDDLTGTSGHTTRVLGDEPAMQAVVLFGE